ncbi:F-box/LRR-repeat protein 7-like [Schistocerca serialis cubense]|uniref:F-box/LRR-repeat protein 7-like n=1 Tax=Schistocerca serialis cubense TaxID=2023355 RepID=UPI00214E062E|nr:F-box/LRR-repeat protein 7-like [Schistocerca serialis cubense]
MAPTSIEELPEELLLEVFTYLPFSDIVTCSRVSRRWQSVTHSSRLWRNLRYRGKGENRLKEAFEITKLAHGFHSLSLELCHGTGVTMSRGEILVSLSPLAWVAFRPTLAEVVERLSPDLTELTVAGPGHLEHHLRLVHRLLLVAPFRRLTSFRALSQCGTVVDDATLGVLCDHCPLLETLVLEGCPADRLTATGGLAQLCRLPRLRTLRLDRKLSFEDFSEMAACLNERLRRPDAAVHCGCKAHDLSFLPQCRGLVSLHLSPCDEFACALPRLRSLTLKCDDVQAVGDRLDAAVRVLPQLRELCLLGRWWVGDEHLRRIRAVAPVSYLYRSELSTTGKVCLGIRFERS